MRADWQEIANRNNRTATEMIWAPSPSLGLQGGATYAGILANGGNPSPFGTYGGGYCTVGGLSMDFWSDDEPVWDGDPSVPGYNVPYLVNLTLSIVDDALKKVPQGGEGGDSYGGDIMIVLG